MFYFKKKLFFLLFRLLEGLNKDYLRNALDELEAFVDDPPAPEQPAAVIVDAGGEGDGCFFAVHRDLHVLTGIEPDQSPELVERFLDHLLDLVVVGKGLAGERRH